MVGHHQLPRKRTLTSFANRRTDERMIVNEQMRENGSDCMADRTNNQATRRMKEQGNERLPVACTLDRSLVRSSFNSFVVPLQSCVFVSSFVRSFVCHSFIRSFCHSLVCSFVRSSVFGYSFVCSFVYQFVRLFVRLCVCSFFGSFTRSFVCSVFHESAPSFIYIC